MSLEIWPQTKSKRTDSSPSYVDLSASEVNTGAVVLKQDLVKLQALPFKHGGINLSNL